MEYGEYDDDVDDTMLTLLRLKSLCFSSSHHTTLYMRL